MPRGAASKKKISEQRGDGVDGQVKNKNGPLSRKKEKGRAKRGEKEEQLRQSTASLSKKIMQEEERKTPRKSQERGGAK